MHFSYADTIRKRLSGTCHRRPAYRRRVERRECFALDRAFLGYRQQTPRRGNGRCLSGNSGVRRAARPHGSETPHSIAAPPRFCCDASVTSSRCHTSIRWWISATRSPLPSPSRSPCSIWQTSRVETWSSGAPTAAKTYETFGGGLETPDAGEVIFADAAGRAHARRWVNRQSGHSAVRDATTSALIVAEAMHATADPDIVRLMDTLRRTAVETWLLVAIVDRPGR